MFDGLKKLLEGKLFEQPKKPQPAQTPSRNVVRPTPAVTARVQPPQQNFLQRQNTMMQNTITPTVTPKPVTIAPPPRVTTPRPAPKPVAPQRNPIQQFGDFAGKVNDATFGTVARVGTDIAKSTASFGQRAATTVGQAAVGVYGAGDTLASKIQGQNFVADQKSKNYTKMIQNMGNGTAIDGGKTGFISNESMAGKASPTQFAKEFINAGVETSNLVPAGRVLSGVQKAAGFSKPMVKEILATNAKQAGIFGTATTANDKLQGREVNAQSLAMNYGAPFLLGSASEFGGVAAAKSAPHVKRAAVEAVDNLNSGAIKHAETVSGLPKVNVLNDNEAYTLADWGDYLGKRDLTDTTNPKVVQEINARAKQAYHAAKNAGVDIQSGSARDIQNRIADYLERRDAFKSGYKQASESGGVPAGMFDPTGGRLGKKPDVPKQDLIIKNGEGKAMSIEDPTAANGGKQLNNHGVRPHDNASPSQPVKIPRHIEEYAAESTPQSIIDETVDYWYKHGKDTKGGQLIDTTGVNDAYGSGMKRISEHNQFYSDFYKEFKRAPTKKDYVDEIERQLQSGGGSMVEPDMATAYQLTKQRIADQGAIVNAKPQEPDYTYIPDRPVTPFEQDLKRAGIIPSGPRKTNGRTNTKPDLIPANRADLQPTQAPTQSEAQLKDRPASLEPVQGKIDQQILQQSSSKSKLEQKAPLVKDTQRALAGNDRTTYGLIDSFDDSPNVPKDLQDALGAFGNERTVRSNKELYQTAQARVSKDPIEAMDFFNKTNSDESVAVGYVLINKYMKEGNVKEAGNIAMNMAERALEAGRTTQAYALMKRLTPEGHIAYVEKKVARFINKHPKQEGKLNWNDGVREQLYNMADQVQKMPEGRERNLLIGKMQETVDNIFPSSVVDKAITVWKAGLLTSFRTHERNILSNAINLASEQASTWPGAIADKLMSARTKQRTLIASTGEGILAGTKKGAQIAKDQIKTGVDVTNSNIKYNINHITWSDSKVEKTLKGFTEGVFRPLGAEDKLFKEAARSNSIRNQAYTAAKNKKLKGTDFDNAVSDLIDNPTPKMMDIAEQDAGRATFTHDNRLGEIIKDAKAAVRRSNKPGAKAASAALDILMPFTQVPSGVASQLYAYSPAKLVKSMYDIGKVMITNDTDLQRTAAQGFGRSVIGTSLLGAGAYLYSQGKITGQPKDDQEKAQWEAQGIKPNSIKVGDRWYQISSIGPQAILALAGGQYVSDKDNGQDPNINLAANLGNSLKDQTFLKGMSSALDAIGDPNRYMQNYIDQQATSVVPNLVKDIARAFDPESRQTNGIVDKFKSSIPGLSSSLPQRYDSYGQPIHNDGVLEMVDLFNSSKQKQIDEVDYVQMLRDATGAKEHIPSKADRSIQINGATMKLTSQQQSDYQKYIGEKSKQVIGALAKDDNFISLSPDEKVKKIDNALKDINSAAKIELFGNQPKNVSSSVQDVLNGGDPSWSTGKEASYKQQYEKALSDFQKDGGSLSPIERAKKQKNIAYLSVQKDYDKDTVSLYGMGESDIYGLLDNLPEKESSQYFNMILKYGDALVEKGLLKTNKLRDRYGNVQYVRGSGGKVSYTTGGRSSGGRRTSSRSTGGGRVGTRSSAGKFDYKLFGFSGDSKGTSNSKQLYDLLKKAKMRRGIA